jgi:hypothetical protein
MRKLMLVLFLNGMAISQEAAPDGGLQLRGERIEPYPYPELAPTHRVASQKDLDDALPKLKAGDVVEIANGTYDSFRVVLPAGLEKIVFRAQAPQGVVFTGGTRFNVQGRHLTLQGFLFKGCREGTVLLGGSFNRLTRCHFIECGHPQKTQSEIVILVPGTQKAEVDYNEFAGSLSMSIKVRADLENTPEGTKDNHLHHNVFRDIKRLSSNGQEAVQLAGPGGAGTHQAMNTLVEHNLFLRASGDREAISIKGPWNVVRWNVFKDMDAAINLRGSSDCVIEGNVHINTRAMRVCGERHRIVNNYFQGSSIFISHGSPGYGPARDNLIAHNTIVGSKSGIVIGAQSQPIGRRAEKNRLINNIVVARKKYDPIVLQPEDEAANVFDRNLLWAGGGGIRMPEAPAGSKSFQGDPLITPDPNEYVPVLKEGSPALNQGATGLVPANIRGALRTSWNIGAY